MWEEVGWLILRHCPWLRLQGMRQPGNTASHKGICKIMNCVTDGLGEESFL
jgi:hypothetical protein